MSEEISVNDLAPEAAKGEIDKWMGDFNSAYWKKTDAGHEAAVNRVRDLHEHVYGGPTEGRKKGTNTQTEAETEEAALLEASESERSLREEWKDQYDGNVETARNGYDWFSENLLGDDQELEAIIESLGNKKPIIRLFHRLGVLMKEAQGGQGE